MRALVICTTTMSRLYILDLVKELRISREHVTIVTHYPTHLFDESLVASLQLEGATVQQGTFNNPLQRYSSLRRNGKLIRDQMEEGNLDIFFVHPCHTLTNYVAFNAHRYRNVSLNLIPDGIANHYMVAIEPYLEVMKKRQLVAFLIGLPFTRYKSNYLGLGDIQYKEYWYCGSEGILGDYMGLHKFEVVLPVLRGSERKDTLFIGQPGEGDEFWTTYSQVIRSASANVLGDFYYRPHPSEVVDATRIRQAARCEVTISASSKSGEVEALPFARIMGVVSSVLLNLRVLGWHDEVYGVTDAVLVEALTGRSREEAEFIASTGKHVGYKSFLSAE